MNLVLQGVYLLGAFIYWLLVAVAAACIIIETHKWTQNVIQEVQRRKNS